MTYQFQRSMAQFERASRSLAGGVATAFRSAQQPVPVSFTTGRGSRLTDVDGNEYVDYALGFGPMLLGHSPEPVLEAVRRQLDRGLGFGASHELEAELAEAVCRTVPSAELCVFGSTGSEAVHSAIRIARAATGRNRVIKFLGHYHGWLDPVHVGVPGQTGKAPATGGQDPEASASVTVCRWNDVDALSDALADDVAAVIMEPAAINVGAFPPAPGYLERAKELTARAGAVLIFDEVITGYRLALGGAQQRYGVLPDLTVLGKALGAGFPISAVCGRRDVMAVVADRRVSHVGTFNANPVCASAAAAAIGVLERDADSLYPLLDELGARLAEDLRATLEFPGMMVGRLEGRFLEMITFALGARSVLEIGTFGGYSSLAMAAGLWSSTRSARPPAGSCRTRRCSRTRMRWPRGRTSTGGSPGPCCRRECTSSRAACSTSRPRTRRQTWT